MPVGVGIVQYLDLVAAHGAAIAAVLVLSTLATLLATAGVFLLIKRLKVDGR